MIFDWYKKYITHITSMEKSSHLIITPLVFKFQSPYNCYTGFNALVAINVGIYSEIFSDSHTSS